MIEHHLERVGTHAGLLASRFSRNSEKSLEARPGLHGQAKPMAVDKKHEGCKGDKDWQLRQP